MSRGGAKKRQNRQSNKVVVAYCHPHEVSAAFHSCMVSLLLYDQKGVRRIADVIGTLSGPRVATARNEMVKAFLAHPYEPEWLWMVDTDMTFPPNVLDTYLHVADPEEVPILGGLCFIGGGGTGKVDPTLKVLEKNEDGNVSFRTIRDYPRNALVQIDATGAACLLIHRDVLVKMGEKWSETAHPWFKETSEPGWELGEDITFCLRAREIGYPVSVHTGIKIGHVKPTVIDEDSFDAYMAAVGEEGEEEFAARNLARKGIRGQVIKA